MHCTKTTKMDKIMTFTSLMCHEPGLCHKRLIQQKKQLRFPQSDQLYYEFQYERCQVRGD